MKQEAPQYNPISSEKPGEKCGTLLVRSKDGSDIVSDAIAYHKEQQHRGSDSAGMAMWDDGKLVIYKGLGRIDQVFHEGVKLGSSDRVKLHNRWATSKKDGVDDISEAQPIHSQYGKWEASISYNGNLPSGVREVLREKIPAELRKEDSVDTEDLIDGLVSAPGEDWPDKFQSTFTGVEGALSITVMTGEGRTFGYRGQSGTWPLWLGEKEDRFVLTSETRIEKAFKEEFDWREVVPGELIEITDDNKIISRQLFLPSKELMAECTLHAMYNARPDSLMAITPHGEKAVYGDFREASGEQLAIEHPIKADVYLGVPKTGLPIMEAYARRLGVEVTNAISLRVEDDTRAETRSYIQSSIEKAAELIHGKYDVDPDLVKDKIVVAADDSIIKGLTARGIPEKGKKGTVQMLRDAGAKEVHLLFAMPKFVEGCDMGVVIEKDTLIAMVHQEDGSYLERTPEQIAELIGADSVNFLSIEGLKKAYKQVTERETICTACLGGGHPLDKNKPVSVQAMAGVH